MEPQNTPLEEEIRIFQIHQFQVPRVSSSSGGVFPGGFQPTQLRSKSPTLKRKHFDGPKFSQVFGKNVTTMSSWKSIASSKLSNPKNKTELLFWGDASLNLIWKLVSPDKRFFVDP